MKRLLSLILIGVALAVAAAGCGSSQPVGGGSVLQQNVQHVQGEEEAHETPAQRQAARNEEVKLHEEEANRNAQTVHAEESVGR